MCSDFSPSQWWEKYKELLPWKAVGSSASSSPPGGPEPTAWISLPRIRAHGPVTVPKPLILCPPGSQVNSQSSQPVAMTWWQLSLPCPNSASKPIHPDTHTCSLTLPACSRPRGSGLCFTPRLQLSYYLSYRIIHIGLKERILSCHQILSAFLLASPWFLEAHPTNQEFRFSYSPGP